MEKGINQGRLALLMELAKDKFGTLPAFAEEKLRNASARELEELRKGLLKQGGRQTEVAKHFLYWQQFYNKFHSPGRAGSLQAGKIVCGSPICFDYIETVSFYMGCFCNRKQK